MRPPVVRRHMFAGGTGLTRVLWWDSDEPASGPGQLILKLTPKLSPALIEDGFIQTRLGLDVLARLVDSPCRRPGQVPHPQVLDAHHRVVVADGGRDFVQVVEAGIRDSGVDALDAGSRPFPVVAELRLAAHGL